jgi:hypothetical protein
MPRQTDHMLARYAAEIEERQAFIDGIVEGAERETRDLTPQEMELVTRSRERMAVCNEQIEPLRDARRIASESATRVAEIATLIGGPNDGPTTVEYRSAGAYIIDRWRAGVGNDTARARLEVYHRAAAHQTTGDNPGLLPESIIGPVVSFVDSNRPVVTLLGPRQLPGGSWSRPTVQQHTNVQPQSAEKTELVSQKMVINKVPVSPVTYGGYVNVSRQDVDWTSPGIMDIVIGDLAAQYAVQTEHAAANAIVAASVAGPSLGTGANTPDEVAGAFWGAAGAVYNATYGSGRLVAITGTDMLAQLGPMFPPYNPTNAQSAGFAASGFGTGPAGAIAGIPLYVSAGMPANTIIIMSTAAFEAYEDRIGSLQVVEPSVLGVQVAYAGYFATVAILPAGIVKVVKTP